MTVKTIAPTTGIHHDIRPRRRLHHDTSAVIDPPDREDERRGDPPRSSRRRIGQLDVDAHQLEDGVGVAP